MIKLAGKRGETERVKKRCPTLTVKGPAAPEVFAILLRDLRSFVSVATIARVDPVPSEVVLEDHPTTI